jgi:septal ring factor EnvC (AmiA/AmiB activator)
MDSELTILSPHDTQSDQSMFVLEELIDDYPVLQQFFDVVSRLECGIKAMKQNHKKAELSWQKEREVSDSRYVQMQQKYQQLETKYVQQMQEYASLKHQLACLADQVDSIVNVLEDQQNEVLALEEEADVLVES